MKKLMLSAAIVCAAVMSQAATVTWSQANWTAVAGSDDQAVANGSAAYLVNAATLTQATFISAVAGMSDISDVSTYLTGKIVDAAKTGDDMGTFGRVDITTTALTQGSNAKAYYVVIDADNNNVFMSSVNDTTYTSVGDAYTFNFGEKDAGYSNNAAFTDYTESQGAGWYAVGAPEPTSGLLLLIGMAGLALRRRRA